MFKEGDGVRVNVRRVIIQFHPNHFGIGLSRLVELTRCGQEFDQVFVHDEVLGIHSSRFLKLCDSLFVLTPVKTAEIRNRPLVPGIDPHPLAIGFHRPVIFDGHETVIHPLNRESLADAGTTAHLKGPDELTFSPVLPVASCDKSDRGSKRALAKFGSSLIAFSRNGIAATGPFDCFASTPQLQAFNASREAEVARSIGVLNFCRLSISKRRSRELRKGIYPQISQIDADWFMHSESAKMDLVICGSIIPIHGRRER
jgi:hypothetical protein